MPVLDWIGKKQVINHDKEIPFRLLKRVDSLSVGKSENLIIKGDNLEALKALLPYYYNKVKCIYIDPPYNIGKDWSYNDRVNSPEIKKWLGKVVGQEGEDLSRHDKWLCMMYPRLKLLKELLSKDGVICVSIDDTELACLIELMSEIFGENNKEEVIAWRRRHNQPNDKSKAISKVAEFIVIYAKNLEYLKKENAFKGLPLTGTFSNPDNDPKGDWASKPWKAGTGQSGSRYKIETPTGKVLDEEWLGSEETYKAYLVEGRMYFPKKGDGYPRKKYYEYEREEEGQCAHNFWGHEEFGSNQEASTEIKNIGVKFDNPKPVKLIKALSTIFSQKDSIILDSFAGTGTTAHAVLDLNREDGGNRKFILVELEQDIAKKVTAERVKKVMRGYHIQGNKGEDIKVEGLGGGFQFMKLDTALFDAHGLINNDITYIDLARYIFFSETKLDLKEKLMKGYFIGENNRAEFYLIYKTGKQNILNERTISKVKKTDKQKVVYADNCTLDAEMLDNLRIVFKQIPYEVRDF